MEKCLGGVLGGLVAITACCNVVSPFSAVVIGVLAGVIHNYAFDLILKKFRLDDPVGAIPVHGVCGVFGTLCVALFGQADMLAHPRFMQLGVQCIGILTCFVWTTGTAYVLYRILKTTVGLRVSPVEESAGCSLGSDGSAAEYKPAPVTQDLDAEELEELMSV